MPSLLSIFQSSPLSLIRNGLSSLFSSNNIERNGLPLIGEAFLPRTNAQGQQIDSRYTMAQNNPLTGLAGSLGSNVNPMTGLFARAATAGVSAGVSAANPYVGAAIGLGTLVSGAYDAYQDTQKANREAEARQQAELETVKRNQLYDDFHAFTTAYLHDRQKILDQLSKNESSNELKMERQNFAPQTTNTIKRYNNLQIQNQTSFTILPTTPYIPPRARNVNARSDRYRTSSLQLAYNRLA